jgi:predicted P-loop ATPase/GTPase
VFGLLSDSPGKTLVSRAIVRGLINRGLDVGVFKPRSGHNYWYQYDAFLKCREEGQLFCQDIIELREARGGDALPIVLTNPVDALMSPLRVGDYLLGKNWNQFYIDEYQTFLHLVMERYTIYSGDIRNIICINSAGIKDVLFSEENFVKEVISKASEIIQIDSLEKWNQLYEDLSSKAILSCYRKVCEEHGNVLVEGYNDAVCPNPDLVYNVVIGVAPGVAIFYEPERFSQIIKFMKDLGKDPLGLRAEHILEYAKEVKTIQVPSLVSEEKKDTEILSRRLSPIVDYVEGRLEKNHQFLVQNK